MQHIEHIVHAKWIISGEPGKPVLENHSLCIDKGKIQDILLTSKVSESYTSERTDSYSDHVVMPGIINAHTHIGMNFFRGLGSDLPLMEWLHNHMFPAEKKWLSHEFVRDASLFAMAEMIRSGTTCFNDMFYFLQATAEATLQSGMRSCIGIPVIEFPTNWAETTDEYFAKGMDFYAEYKDNPYIQISYSPHAPYTVSDDSFVKIRDLAAEKNMKINLHLHETMDEINSSIDQYGKRPIRRLFELGFLSDRVISIHSANLNEEDLEIFAETRPSIAHCPESNMKLASGTCPIEKLKSIGLNIALGTDSVASNNDLDMLSEMRTASFLAKLSTLNPESLNASDTISMATLNGAQALGLAATIGSLESGKEADFIAISMQDTEMLPVYDPASQVVYSSNREQVSDVWVHGRQLMKDRKLLTLDEQELKQKARLWGEKIRS